jgi:hypothetical protein
MQQGLRHQLTFWPWDFAHSQYLSTSAADIVRLCSRKTLEHALYRIGGKSSASPLGSSVHPISIEPMSPGAHGVYRSLSSTLICNGP